MVVKIVFDYARLDDLDFEKLCSDMMGRILGRELRYFPSGRDGGIDLVDDILEKNILIQVKHYEKSTFSIFKHALKKEVTKVENLQPKQYYIFTSQSLNPANIEEVYLMFQGYMDSERNIITRENIDQFLKNEENVDILRSQFKLWITADIVLKDFLNQDIFIDSEVLLSDIDNEIKYFVQTDIFNKCIKTLETERKILIYGDPGVGKTLNSKMLLLHFVKQGYRVRYSSNGEIAELKSSVTSNKDVKEIIFLDDCLGQYYFKLREGHDQELLSLIKHIDLYKNKVLILNSRVTILNEALNAFEELERYFGLEKITLRKINMNEISIVEKAKIFYATLKRNKVSNNYYNSVRRNKNYLSVVEHTNFNPRVIEYVTFQNRLKTVSSDKYYEFILENLNNPKDIWKNEFERRIKDVDRIFMFTLYSLTDTYVSKDILEECFDYFLSKDSQIDTTLHNFESTLIRLNHSMVRIVDSFGIEKVGVLNPSINDYMNSTIIKNKLLLEKLRENALYIDQLERLYSPKEFNKRLKELVRDDKLFEYKTIKKGQLFEIRLHTIGENIILDDRYMLDINMLVVLNEITRLGQYNRSKVNVIKNFVRKTELSDFYELKDILSDPENIERLFNDLSFEDASYLMGLIIEFLEEHQAYTEVISNYFLEKLLGELESYVDNIEYWSLVDSWCDPNLQDEVLQEDYNSIINEIQKEIENLICGINDDIIVLNIENHFQSFESTIESYIDEVFQEMLEESNKPQEESLLESNIGVDDILDRPV